MGRSSDRRHRGGSFVVGLAAGVFLVSGCGARTDAPLVFDLTHQIETFAPREGRPTAADLARPHDGSRPVPTFAEQAVYEILPEMEAGQGRFYGGRLVLYDHHGTHLDAPTHYRNDAASLEVEMPDGRDAGALRAEDLIGPVVFLDISPRVLGELNKNGGRPSPDLSVTNFSNVSRSVVTAEDVDRIADELGDGVWLVVNSGWSRFFAGSGLEQSDYINGWNYPGMSKRACDRLIEVEDKRDFRIGGIVMDNIGIDSGESSVDSRQPWHCHVRGLQRGWKFVENATSLGDLAYARPGSCTLVVGALKHRAGSGGAARVFALCEPQ